MGNFNSPDNLRSAMEAWKHWAFSVINGTAKIVDCK